MCCKLPDGKRGKGQSKIKLNKKNTHTDLFLTTFATTKEEGGRSWWLRVRE